MPNRRKLFSELIGYVLLFEQTNQQGEFQPSYEQVRHDIAALLEQEKVAVKREGMSDRDYEDASFALIAWADETILKHKSWQHHAEWNTHPLQLEYFQTRNAGEEFFERLERLRPEQKDVREVYYLCLGLGFSGRYFLGLEDELKLNRIRHEQAQHLPLLVEDARDIDKLTAQPYEIQPLMNGQVKLPWTDLLLKAGLPLLVIIPLTLALVYWFWLAPPPTPQPPLAERVGQWLDSHPLPCAKISNIAVQGRVVTLDGRVASEAQRAEILQGVQNLEKGVRVNAALQMIPWPFCEVLDLLEPLRKHNEDQALGLAASLNKSGDPPLYYDNENFTVEVRTPTKFESYMYVDYYSTDETVGHLFPNAEETSNRFGPNESYTVGRLDGPHPWSVTPPFGRDLVTVISSKTPLFLQPRPPSEPAQAYLKDLRQALLRDGAKPDLTATFYFLQTQSGP